MWDPKTHYLYTYSFILRKHKAHAEEVKKERKKEKTMSYLLPHLHSGWAVDQAILAEEERLVIIRFGHDWDETCMQVILLSNLLFVDVFRVNVWYFVFCLYILGIMRLY